MKIQIDTREHEKERIRIEKQLDQLGIDHFVKKLDTGDYMNVDNPGLIIDRKKNLQEICQNITKQHERFRRELLRAEKAGIQLVILCEEGNGIECMEDVMFWENPRRTEMEWRMVNGHPVRQVVSPNAINGSSLFKAMCSMQDRYGVRWLFCSEDETGRRIADILGGGYG